jgi:hypothetical protein
MINKIKKIFKIIIKIQDQYIDYFLCIFKKVMRWLY